MLRTSQLLVLLLCPFLLKAQSVDRQVVGSFGGTHSIDSLYLNSSLGELNVDHFDGSFYVQQGFIQAEDWVFVGVEEEQGNAVVSLYPNPSSSYFTLDLSKAGRYNDLIQVFDINGQLVHSEQNGVQSRVVIDAYAWSPGIYFVRLTSPEGKVHTIKFHKI